MIYGYARVSTKGQFRYGNSLSDQESKLREAGCTEIVHDSFTGKTMDRPELAKLLEKLQPGDVLTVTKLDRFARNAAEGAQMIHDLVKRGIGVYVLNMGKADDGPMGKLMVNILLAFADYERDMILERTASGKAVKRASDPEWREGRKMVDTPDLEKFLKKQKEGLLSVSDCCKALGISRSTWYNRVNAVEG